MCQKIQYENGQSCLEENLEILSYKQLSRNLKKNLEDIPFMISENCIEIDVSFLVRETFEKIVAGNNPIKNDIPKDIDLIQLSQNFQIFLKNFENFKKIS